VNVRIVAEVFEPGVRVVDVARRHGPIANQLFDWRRQVRDGILVLPFAATTTASEYDGTEPAFVPLAIAAEPLEPINRLPLPKLASDAPQVQVLMLQMGSDVVMRVPNDVPGTGRRSGSRGARSVIIAAGHRLPILIATRPVDFRCGHRAWL
jgi:transposase